MFVSILAPALRTSFVLSELVTRWSGVDDVESQKPGSRHLISSRRSLEGGMYCADWQISLDSPMTVSLSG
jgi:hypothetical protein